MDNGSLVPEVAYFDGKHIDFNNITGNISNLKWQKETLTGKVDVSAEERSGLVIRTLKTDLTISPKSMTFDNLLLQTNKSTVGNFFAMRFASMKSLGNFIHDVTMEANFVKSVIDSDDLALFAPAVRDWNRNLRIDGHVEGTVDALAGNNMELTLGTST